jgi:glutamine amidotransferase
MTIGIIDYGMGNLGSVSNACAFLNLPAQIVTKPDALAACRGLILPGVGAFGDAVKHLEEHGLLVPVKKWIQDDRPFLGICLGLQMLFAGSEESPGVRGLDLYPGSVKKFATVEGLKVPQIGWNRVALRQPEHPLFHGIVDGTHFYFVHSYYVDCGDASLVAGETGYGIDYVSAVAKGRVAAVQFHPEKSQQAGLTMLKNFGVMAQ